MSKQPSYIAINASAGSGKTYALVQKILLICLKQPHQHDSIKNILALTFTNKAANEMKERILSWLKAFTQNDYESNNDLKGIQTKLKEMGLTVSLHDLHQRATYVLDYILHHYSTLNISTIDKFNSKLVRSFSYELGLPHQFNLEITHEPYLIEAIDRLLQEIGEDGQISDAFLDLVNYSLENDEKININKALYKKANQFINDVHYNQIARNKDYDWESYEKLKTNIRQKIEDEKSEAAKIVADSLSLISDNGLATEDFPGGKQNSIAKFFVSYDEKVIKGGENFAFPPDEEKALVNFSKFPAKRKPNHDIAETIIAPLIENRRKVIYINISKVKHEKILKELLPFKFNKEIQDQLKIIEEENDLVLLSKFNIIINENLKDEPSSFIYEKIGTKFNHFFIDEFQDTSKMQWQNILPLRDNNIAEEGNSFTIVGDPKQSIYSFRGGDSEIMLDILNGKENVIIPVHIENLENNWRSSKNIVEFNNTLYQYVGSLLNAEHEDLFAVKGKQNIVKKELGRVKIGLTEYTRSSAEFFENSTEQMFRNIQESVDNSYNLSDITIICRKGSEIKKYTEGLGQKKIQYKNQEQYIKTISDKGLTLNLSHTLQALIYYIQWELEPKNFQYTVKFLYHLKELGKISFQDFTKEVSEIMESKSKLIIEKQLQKQFGLQISGDDVPQLNLYNYVEFLINQFSVEGKEIEYILNFLELVYKFTQTPGATLKDFIKFWEEEAQDTSIQASNNIDAVKLMTIHAAKGLEFPIVFIPMMNGNKDNDFNQWFDLDETETLKSIHISNFSKEITQYDESIKVFNEVNSYKNLVDRLCVLYVATTRASEQLYLYLQKPSKNGVGNEMYNFIESEFSTLLENDEFDLYPEIDQSFRKQEKKKEKIYNTISITSITEPNKKKNNIKIATPSKNYQKTVAHVREGIFTHDILAQIKYRKDVEKVLQHYILEGTITSDEKNNIQTKILGIIDNPAYAPYFEEGLKIITEKDILITRDNGPEFYRPDRIVETNEGYIIIDYKTQKDKDKDVELKLEKHQEQVDNYKSILEHFGKKVIKTEIIYT